VGVQFHGLWTDWTEREQAAVLDRMAEAGVRWVRVDVGWASLEESGTGVPSGWYVRRVDRVVDMARRRGLRVLATLWGTPGWANGGREAGIPPRDPADYARAAGWAARRWRGRIQAWEIWNEPNQDAFFAGRDPAEYARLLRAAYPAVKRGSPRALVGLGGPAYNHTAWLEGVYEAGAAGSFDVMATHPYPAPSDGAPEAGEAGSPWSLSHVRAVRDLMRRNGDGGKRIGLTEIGWSTHATASDAAPWERGVSPARQAAYLVRALRLVRREHPYVTHLFWYMARDRDSGDAHGR
jgi:hypothetical protein